MLANILSKVLNADDTLENLLHQKTTANTTTPLYFYFNTLSSGRQAMRRYVKKEKTHVYGSFTIHYIILTYHKG